MSAQFPVSISLAIEPSKKPKVFEERLLNVWRKYMIEVEGHQSYHYILEHAFHCQYNGDSIGIFGYFIVAMWKGEK